MGGIRFIHRGHFEPTMYFLKENLKRKYLKNMDKYGKEGVKALELATPRATGKTAESWDYEIIETEGRVTIQWFNTNVNKGENIAILIQFGHGTVNGGFVKGRDYINPALRPVFDKIAENAWKEVTGK